MNATPAARRPTDWRRITDRPVDDGDYLDALEAGDSIGSLIRPWRPGDPVTVARALY